MDLESLAALISILTAMGGFVYFLRRKWVGRLRLSPQAKQLLREIDQAGKTGLTIFHAPGGAGGYVPYLWSQSQHGQVKVICGDRIHGILAAVDELIRAGYLKKSEAAGQIAWFIRANI